MSKEKKALSAKQYLSQLQIIDTKIQQKIEELEHLKSISYCSSGIDYSRERVQTSQTGDSMQKKVCSYVDMSDEINREIDKFVDIKHKITLEIQELTELNFIKILFKVYVQFKTVKIAADEIGISYQYAKEVHKKALAAFEKMHKRLYYLT